MRKPAMKIRPPLLTFSTLLVALVSAVLLVAAPPRDAGMHTPATANFGDLQGLLTESRS